MSRPPFNRRRPAQSSVTSGRPVIGLHSVAELFKVRPKSVKQLWLREGWEDQPALQELHRQAQQRKIAVHVKAAAQLDRIAASHQGVCAFSGETPQWDFARLSDPGVQSLLVLDGIEDPHNLGAILRTGWLMGVEAIFVPQDRAVHLTPAVMKVASGGAEHVPVEVVSSLPHLLAQLREAGHWVLGLAEQGRGSLWSLEVPAKVAWVIGAEDKGMRKTVMQACDELIHIPQTSGGSSYNASVAAALVLAEGARQHERRNSSLSR